MDGDSFGRILKKEFVLSRRVTRIGLSLSIVANFGLAGIALYFAYSSVVRGFQAEWLASSIGFEMAKIDISRGEPRYLTVVYVDSGARATSLIEKTEEIRDGKNVWQWRCVRGLWSEAQLPYFELFVNEYNKEVISLREGALR